MRNIADRLREATKLIPDRRETIYVCWRPDIISDAFERHAVTNERAFAADEHGG
jgi:hypothetical protein